jgi:hypothetical protein
MVKGHLPTLHHRHHHRHTRLPPGLLHRVLHRRILVPLVPIALNHPQEVGQTPVATTAAAAAAAAPIMLLEADLLLL